MGLQRAWILAVVLLAALAAGPGPQPADARAPVRGIVLSWDGTVPGMVHDLLRQGKLPNLAGLISGGAFADSVVPVFPSKTAPGHASLWTGAPPRVNGITGNRMPASPLRQFTILDSVSGFHSTSLRAEPLWRAASRAGRRAVIVQATQAWPFEPGPGAESLEVANAARPLFFEGYAGVTGRDGVITAVHAPPRDARGWANPPPSLAPPREIAFRAGATRIFGLLTDDPADPAQGYDTLRVAPARDARKSEATLKPGPPRHDRIEKWSATIEIEAEGRSSVGIRLRLFDLKADGTDFLLYFTRPARRLSSDPDLLPALRKAAGVFVGNGASRPYRRGAFGPTIPDGGDGTAERRYLETVVLAQRHWMDATRWVAENAPWDLLFAYIPFPDESEHLWRGYLDPGLRGFRRDVADRLRPFLEEVYRACDEILGMLMELRPANTVIALVADHGMQGANRVVRINEALRRAGLLVLDERGGVDLTRTKALYHTGNNGYIVVNTKKRRGGIIGAGERAAVVARVRRALEGMRDDGRRVVAGVLDARTEGKDFGIGGEAGGDLYLDLLQGYAFDPRIRARDLIKERDPFGAHGFNPLRMAMRTIMVLNGPGSAAGSRIKEARTIDFAPTLARLLGMPAPRHATGRVVEEALAR